MIYETKFNKGDKVVVTHRQEKVFPPGIEKIRRFYKYPPEYTKHSFKAVVTRIRFTDPDYFNQGGYAFYYHTEPSRCPICGSNQNLWREDCLKLDK